MRRHARRYGSFGTALRRDRGRSVLEVLVDLLALLAALAIERVAKHRRERVFADRPSRYAIRSVHHGSLRSIRREANDDVAL